MVHVSITISSLIDEIHDDSLVPPPQFAEHVGRVGHPLPAHPERERVFVAGVFAGDVGTEIMVDCAADITTATVRSIIVRKPTGVKVVWPAEMLTSTMIKYTVVDGDLDVVGRWKLQAYVEMPSGRWFGEVATLNVARPI